MHDALGEQARTHLAGLLPGIELGVAEELSNGPRSTVYRLHIGNTKDGTDSAVIVKWFTGGGAGRARESAALALDLPGLPALVAESVDPPVVVMADLGRGRSLADALLGDDPTHARTALVAWAQAVGALHVASRGLRVEFGAALAARSADLPVQDAPLGADVQDAVRLLERQCASLGVPMPQGAMDEFRALAQRLGGDGDAALTAADACPDNNLLAGDRLTLLDFEGAQWRHIAWDVAYLTVPWPTCWCSWRLPDDATEQALAAYIAIAGPAFAGVADAGFGADVEAATLGWTFLTAARFIGATLDQDRTWGGGADVSPSKRAVVLHRLRGARRASGAPALAELAHRLHADLEHRWGAVPLALAPAFR